MNNHSWRGHFFIDSKNYIYMIPVVSLLIISFYCICCCSSPNAAVADEAGSQKAMTLISDAHRLSLQGNSAFEAGNFDQANSLYEQAITLYEEARALDDNSFIYNDYIDLAGCYRRIDQQEKAISTIQYGIQKMANLSNKDEAQLYSAQLNMFLAGIYKDLRDFDKALEIYRNQNANNAYDVGLYHELADCYLQMGDIEKAKATYEKGFDILTFDDSLYLWFVDFLISNNYLDEAEILTYKAVVFLQNSNYELPEAYKNLVEIYRKQGKSEGLLNWAQEKLEETQKKQEESLPETSNSDERFLIPLIIISIILAIVLLSGVYLVWRSRKKGKISL